VLGSVCRTTFLQFLHLACNISTFHKLAKNIENLAYTTRKVLVFIIPSQIPRLVDCHLKIST
jgi:hypothetical protein